MKFFYNESTFESFENNYKSTINQSLFLFNFSFQPTFYLKIEHL